MAIAFIRTPRGTDSVPGTESEPIRERAYILLKEMIQSGSILPGETLLESRVAKAFSIRRSPVLSLAGFILRGRNSKECDACGREGHLPCGSRLRCHLRQCIV
jgi:hypothetical protein